LFPRRQFAEVTAVIENLLQTGHIDDANLGPPCLDEVYIAFNEKAQNDAE